MANCKRCGKPVVSGVVLHSDCYDELQHKYQMGYFRGRVLGVECDAERGHAIIEAEREGRLLVLPCKIGDCIYIVSPHLNAIFGFTIVQIQAFEEEAFLIDSLGGEHRFDDLGKTYFATRKEAEAALEAEENRSCEIVRQEHVDNMTEEAVKRLAGGSADEV